MAQGNVPLPFSGILRCITASCGSGVGSDGIRINPVCLLISATYNVKTLICEDFNTDLFNPSDHKPTEDFIDTMRSSAKDQQGAAGSHLTEPHWYTHVYWCYRQQCNKWITDQWADQWSPTRVYSLTVTTRRKNWSTDESINQSVTELKLGNIRLYSASLFLSNPLLIHDCLNHFSFLNDLFYWTLRPTTIRTHLRIFNLPCQGFHLHVFIKQRTENKDAENKYKKYKNKFI